jgi:hypothetical protein
MNTADRQLLQQALDAFDSMIGRKPERVDQVIAALRERLAHCDRCGKHLGGEGDIHTCTPDPIGDAQDRLIAELAAQPEKGPVSMRMPKAGDKVICLEDESLATVVSLTAGGSPDIVFSDGSRGTYLLHEFAELFGYATPPAAAPMTEFEEAVAAVDNTLHHAIDHWQDRALKAEAKLAQPEQEPVAWMFQHGETGRMSFVSNDGMNNPELFLAMNPRYALVCALVTPPAAQHQCKWPTCQSEEYQQKLAEQINQELVTGAAQRQWVGLTKYEAAECWYGKNCLEQRPPFDGYAEAIESKLKEKNT